MKKILIMILVSAWVFPLMAGENEWQTSMKEAQELAKKEGKPILVNFSGSDWCGWCMRLDEEVFSKDIFKDYAKDNLILLVLDFPRKKAQAPEIKQQNQTLAEKYSVRGFPTVLLIDAEGKVLVQTGYRQGGSAAYVEFIKKSLSQKQS